MLMLGRNQGQTGSSNGRNYEMSGLNGLRNELPYVRQHSIEDTSPIENPRSSDQTADVIINFRNEDNKRNNDSREPANFNINTQNTNSNNPPGESNVDASVIQEEEWDEASILYVLKSFIFSVLKWNTLSLLLFIFILVAVKWNLSYLYPIVFLWIVDIYNIISTVNTITEASNPQQKKDKIISICQVVLLAIFKIFLVLYLETKSFLIIIPFLPIFLLETTAIIRKIKKKYNFFRSFTLFGIAFHIMTLLQAFLILLKVDDLITWRWREVFWCYWVVLAVLIGITFAGVLMVLSKCCALVFAEIEKYESI